MDILERYSSIIDFAEISKIRSLRRGAISREHWRPFLENLKTLSAYVASRPLPVSFELSGPVVRAGAAGELPPEIEKTLGEAIDQLIPWRKGPFEIFGLEIDAEWRSDLKWDRIVPHLDRLQGARVADIGSSTGYYMFRAGAFQPEVVIGFEPAERCLLSFELLRLFLPSQNLVTEPLGVEQIDLFPNFFDVMLCLGILYHHRNPHKLLLKMKSAMKPGAQIVAESLAIPGDEPVALFAPDRYAKARNVYYIPTAACLAAWLVRAGFKDVEIVSSVKLTEEEQRATRLAPWESLKDFLDPNDSSKTVEGYPAPLRVCVVGRRSEQ